MYDIILPASGPKPKYYSAYVGYIKSILDYNDISYKLEGVVNEGTVQYPTATKFLMKIDNKNIVIDYSDNLDYMSNWHEFDAYFKFHYSKKKHSSFETIYPFTPISFYNWEQYELLEKEIKYTCNNDLVLNMQTPGGNALQRRTNVQTLLKQTYENNVVLNGKEPQINFWKRINDCLVHVFVPGCRNNMIDRGHIQYLAFGCCTISPPLVDQLPYMEITPMIHYIACKEDYSDLVEKIEWVRENREKAIEIGRNAKELFQATSLPKKLWEYMEQKIFGV